MIELIIFLGAALAFVFASLQLIGGLNKNTIVPFFLYLSIAAWQSYAGLLHGRTLLSYPHLYACDLPFAFMTGPLLYWYIKTMPRPVGKLRFIHLTHFIPAIVAVVLLLSVWSAPAEAKIQWIHQTYAGDEPENIRWLNLFSAVSIILYLATLSVRYFGLIYRAAQANVKNRLYVPSFFALFCLFVVTMALLGNQRFGIEIVYQSSIENVLVTIILYMILVFSQRFPTTFVLLQEEIQKKRYARTRIANVDVDDLVQRLENLLREDKVYLNDDLDLHDLASQLGIQSHQLTQILNQRYGQNFNAFINAHRINEAALILKTNTETTILDISLQVGFTSYSSFHAWFIRQHGMSPAAYRKKFAK